MFSVRQVLGARVYPRWFKSWNSELDAVLNALPEAECCSHELYRLLCTNNQDLSKTFAIIYDEIEEPIGVVCLRRREALNDWVPLTHYSIPGMIFPTKEGSLVKVLSVLNNMNVWIAWWRMGDFAEDIDCVRSVEVVPTYEIDCSGGCEEIWRKSNHIRLIKRARKRCEGFEIRINAEHMIEWVISSWERKWRKIHEAQRQDLEDKICIAKYLERCGKQFTFTLHDNENPIAGHTFLVHEKSLVWQYTYRNHDYDEFSAGTYLMYYATKWAIESGFKAIDLGGDYPEHKKKWGSIKGSKTSIHICPKYLITIRRCQEILCYVKAKGLRQSLITATSRIVDNAKACN